MHLTVLELLGAGSRASAEGSGLSLRSLFPEARASAPVDFVTIAASPLSRLQLLHGARRLREPFTFQRTGTVCAGGPALL